MKNFQRNSFLSCHQKNRASQTSIYIDQNHMNEYKKQLTIETIDGLLIVQIFAIFNSIKLLCNHLHLK